MFQLFTDATRHRNVTWNDSNHILPLTDRHRLKTTFTAVWHVKSLLSNIHTKMLMFLISVSSLPATLTLEADFSVQGAGSRRSSDSAITQQWIAPSFTLIHVVQQKGSFLHPFNRRFYFTSTSKCGKLMQKYGHSCITIGSLWAIKWQENQI